MSDADLFSSAVLCAKHRALMLQLAQQAGHNPLNLTRRQLLNRARDSEQRIHSLSIRAEQRCLREMDMKTVAV
jgi:hypothetical protein